FFIHPAIFGRCSPILMPSTAVAISLYGPPLAWPGLRSQRSIVAGPPFIQRRMQERRRCGLAAASAANAGSQPDIDPPSTPAAESFSQSRREKVGWVIGPSPFEPGEAGIGSGATADMHCTTPPGGTPE